MQTLSKIEKTISIASLNYIYKYIRTYIMRHTKLISRDMPKNKKIKNEKIISLGSI